MLASIPTPSIPDGETGVVSWHLKNTTSFRFPQGYVSAVDGVRNNDPILARIPREQAKKKKRKKKGHHDRKCRRKKCIMTFAGRRLWEFPALRDFHHQW